MIFDTHCHLNFNAYKGDADEVLKRSLENSVWTINVGSQYSTSKRAVSLAEKHEEGVFAAVGLHPIHLSEGILKTRIDTEEIEFQIKEENFDYAKYKELAVLPKVVAIGEIGLDYYYRPKTRTKLEQFKQKQKTVFLEQLCLAKDLTLPVIFHCRQAHEDMQEILSMQHINITGVIHCFTGNLEQAKKYLEMGYYLGFNGIIFKLDLEDVIKLTPLDKILIETDCPYLTPPQKQGRNEPVYVKYVAEKIAEIKKIDYESVIDQTFKNAKKLFEII